MEDSTKEEDATSNTYPDSCKQSISNFTLKIRTRNLIPNFGNSEILNSLSKILD